MEDIALPALLRASRGAYSHSIRRRLRAAGFRDMPRNGPYVLGGMGNHGISASDLIPQLGVSKQAASQLVESLVIGGYVSRQPDADDRRRMTLELTDRGRAAAQAVHEGVSAVDEELASMITPTELAGLRAGLIALCDIRDQFELRD